MPGGEHQNRRSIATLAQAPTDRQSIDMGHLHIEQVEVGCAPTGKLERMRTISCQLDLIALEPQRAVQGISDTFVIFGNEEERGHTEPE